MTSREEFAAAARSGHPSQPSSKNGGSNGTPSEWIESLARHTSRPPPARKYGEQAPLLMPPSAPLPPSVPATSSWPVPQAGPLRSPTSRGKGHARSTSDYIRAPKPPQPPPPFGQEPSLAPKHGSSKPPRASHLPSQRQAVPSGPAHGRGANGHRRLHSHRRVKSDIPLAIFGGGGHGSVGSVGGGQPITKADLLKNFPNPRWGGAAPRITPLNHSRQRSRTGSDGLYGHEGNGSMPELTCSGSVTSVPSLYGAVTADADGYGHRALQSIGSVDLGPDAQRRGHVRHTSDASARSVTTNIARSALFKTVTETGRIQMQLPKDSFRLLMDGALEAGQVYKRRLVDNEDEFFLEFYTEEDDPLGNEERKHLPPDLYVMAVDGTLYRRMLDEVIQSRSMPFGTFFCGHHEDVRHPDITVASLVVGALMLVALVLIKMDPS